MNVLAVDGVGIAFGGVKAVDAVSFEAKAGSVLAIIGPNGAGKTTLFNLVSGVYRTGTGRIVLNGVDVTGLSPFALAQRGLSRTFQNLQIFQRMTALENVMVGAHRHRQGSVLADLFRWPGTGAAERRMRAEALDLLASVGLADEAGRRAGALPYGAMKRLEIARALASRPSILLLDEPAAGLNATETHDVDRLIADIARRGIAVVLIEHDMKLVMAISERVLVMEQGRVLAEGAPEAIARDPRVIQAYLGAGYVSLTDAPADEPAPARA